MRFASLGTTEQGESGAQFYINYLKPSGAIGFYHPDWVVVQKGEKGEINWIIETKGRVWEGIEAKDAGLRANGGEVYCGDIIEAVAKSLDITLRERSLIDPCGSNKFEHSCHAATQ